MTDFEAAADQILASTSKPKRAGVVKLTVEPEPKPLPTTLAEAYAAGFNDGAEHVSRCCGCSGGDPGDNPYDGSPL
jgi:hypothetical protein